MKNLIVIILVVVSGSLTAQTFAKVTADIRFFDQEEVVNTTIFVAKPIKGKWGVSCFAQVTEVWAQAYAGPTYKVTDKLTLGVSIGIENMPSLRGAVSATYFAGKHSALLFLEKGVGEGNYWYSLSYEYKHNKVSYGVIARRFYGIGPSLAVSIESSTFTVAPLYDTEVGILKLTTIFTHVF